jgi:hypothetical protein
MAKGRLGYLVAIIVVVIDTGIDFMRNLRVAYDEAAFDVIRILKLSAQQLSCPSRTFDSRMTWMRLAQSPIELTAANPNETQRTLTSY